MDRLVAFIEARRDRPHEWGENDCVMFVADYYALMTGTDYAADIRGTYHTEAEAVALLRARGGVKKLLTSYLGPARIAREIRRGDIVCGDFGMGVACGICVGHAIAAVSDRGLSFFALGNARWCWHG